MKKNKADKDIINVKKFFLDLDKEFAFINEMNKKGWKLLCIKYGFSYSFKRTLPDEYVTIMHAENEERIAEVTAFAAKCGYESIPHSMDGFGELLYLMGKKNEISEEFVSEASAKAFVYEKLIKKFSKYNILNWILAVLLLLETAFFIFTGIIWGFDAAIITIVAITSSAGILTAINLIKILIMKSRYKKNIKAIQNDAVIFE